MFVKASSHETGEFEALFTCTPYNLKETWGQEIQNLSCDEWIDVCLKNFTCKKYVFVVDSTIKYKDFIKEEKENKSHFGTSKEYVVVLEKEELK